MPASARRTYFESMMSHGFTILRLHKVDSDGVCQCRAGKDCRNPGKHFATRYGWQSVIPTVDEVEQHLDEGGSVGLSLWYEDARIPQSPGRLVVFDCDEAAAEPWLRSQGITSPLMVHGRRGVHVYCRMPAHVPELKSDTRTLQNPRIDIKVSGLVVLPWSPDKRLFIDGRDVSNDPAAIAAFFGDHQRLLASLPEVDPRTLVPGMTLRYPQPVTVTRAPAATTTQLMAAAAFPATSAAPATVPAPPPSRAPRRRVRFSEYHPTTFYSGYVGLQYNRRKNNAITHAGNLDPSIEGKAPRQKLLKVAADCIIHYGMSDQDTWEIIRDKFNPRCRSKDGGRYPWRKDEVAWAIEVAHQPDSYSTLNEIRGPVDISNALAHERARGEHANARRLAAQRSARSRDFGNARSFIQTYYEADATAQLPFAELLRAVNRALTFEEQEPVSGKRLGMLLAEDGISSERGVVTGLKVRLCDNPSLCHNSLLYRVCPAAPCPIYFQGGV
jgi:hypothetical protein